MALQTIPGQGLWIPNLYIINTAPGVSAAVIDATGEKVAFVGRVWNRDRGTKSISKVGFRFGVVTKAGGSALTVSLQDISLTGGPPIIPDETQDQTVAIANGDANFATNTWYQTAALSANRSVAFGELLAVVIEFDGGGRLGADSVQVSYLQSGVVMAQGTVVLKTAGWALSGNAQPGVILEFTDGTFGTLLGGVPIAAIGTHTYKQDTAGADEYALRFQLPAPVKVDAAMAILRPSATTADYDFVLYDGTTPMTGGTVSVDAHAVGETASIRNHIVPFSQEIQLAANTTYYLAVKPTQTTANVILQYMDVAAAGHWRAHGGGMELYQAARLDGGAWTTTDTRRPMMALHVSAFDDGAGGSGGPVGSGRLTGGLQ